MARYIDADKLTSELAIELQKSSVPRKNEKSNIPYLLNLNKINYALFLLSVTETEDVAPVIHAHWTRKRTLSHDGELYCSKCEWTPEVLGGTTLGDLQLADVYYCPHCGAAMDETEVAE